LQITELVERLQIGAALMLRSVASAVVAIWAMQPRATATNASVALIEASSTIVSR
jgi:hypothetical protein